MEMQVKLLASLISSRGIVTGDCIYNNPEDSLYKGFFHSQPASIRFQRVFPGCDEEKLQQEIQIMRTLEHEQILKLFDCFRLDSEVGNYLIVVTEFCANTADKDMELRLKAGHYREETELRTLSIQLISVFAYMQRRGFAHRCISPACLYITKASVLVGDFSDAITAPSSLIIRSIKGQSCYHSPRIVEAILAGHVSVAHNVYKSDLYSLGLTLLALAKLETSQRIALTGHMPEAVIEEIRACGYSDYFTKILLAMLEEEEEKRMDFVEFEEWIGVQPSPIPAVISQEEVKLQVVPKEEEKSLKPERERSKDLDTSSKSEKDCKGEEKGSPQTGDKPTETTTLSPPNTQLPGERKSRKWHCCSLL